MIDNHSKITILFLLGITLVGLTSIPDSFAVDSTTLYTCDADPDTSFDEIHQVRTQNGEARFTNGETFIITNGTGTPFIEPFDKCLGLATDPTDQQLYAIMLDDNNNRFLATILPYNGTVQIIDQLVIDGDDLANSLAFDSSGQLYATLSNEGGSNNDFFTVNKSTAVATSICTFTNSVDANHHVTLNHDDGNMYHIDDTGNDVHFGIIDVNDPDCISTEQNLSTSLLKIMDWSYNTEDGLFYLLDNKDAPQNIWTITTSGTLNQISIDATDQTGRQRGLEFALIDEAVLLRVVQVSIDNEQSDFGDFGNHETDDQDLVVVGNTGHLIWTETNDISGDGEIEYSKTTDGITWSTPIIIDTALGTADNRQLLVDGDNVHVFYHSGGYKVSTSNDGGDTFNAPVIILSPVASEDQYAQVDGSVCSVVAGNFETPDTLAYKRSTDSCASFGDPVIICDELGSGSDPKCNDASDIRLEQSTDGTRLWTVWEDEPVNSDDEELYYSQSTNSGTSWSTPSFVSTANGFNHAGAMAFEIFIDESEEEVLILFQGSDAGGAYLSYVKSTDFGSTFSSEVEITGTDACRWNYNEASNFSQDSNDDQIVHVICTVKGVSQATVDVLTFRTDDFGDTWTTPTTLTSGFTNPVELFGNDNIVIEAISRNVFYGFEAREPDHFILVNSTDGGDTFGEKSVFIQSHDPDNFSWSQLVASDNILILATEVHSLFDTNATNGFGRDIGAYYTEFEPLLFPPPDNVIPVITLLGDELTFIEIGNTYVDDGATALDDIDGNITNDIVVGGDTVNTSVEAVFIITFNVADSSNNNAIEVIRTVVVTQQQSGGGGIGQGSSVGDPEPTVSDLDIEDLDSEQIQDLLDMLAPALQTTIIQEIIQTFFEFQVIDKEHRDIVIQSFLPNEQLGIRWSTGDDIVITSVVPANSPFTFTFEQVPVIKQGSGSAISENAISYNLQVPSEQCGEEFSFDCVDTIRYSVPVTVNALINGTQVNAVGTILVDLTTEDINPVLVILFFTILIPIVAGIIWKIRGGHNPSKVSELLK